MANSSVPAPISDAPSNQDPVARAAVDLIAASHHSEAEVLVNLAPSCAPVRRPQGRKAHMTGTPNHLDIYLSHATRQHPHVPARSARPHRVSGNVWE